PIKPETELNFCPSSTRLIFLTAAKVLNPSILLPVSSVLVQRLSFGVCRNQTPGHVCLRGEAPMAAMSLGADGQVRTETRPGGNECRRGTPPNTWVWSWARGGPVGLVPRCSSSPHYQLISAVGACVTAQPCSCGAARLPDKQHAPSLSSLTTTTTLWQPPAAGPFVPPLPPPVSRLILPLSLLALASA
ncbi:unnamed protein product, partial [Pleuronectes platessa]